MNEYPLRDQFRELREQKAGIGANLFLQRCILNTLMVVLLERAGILKVGRKNTYAQDPSASDSGAGETSCPISDHAHCWLDVGPPCLFFRHIFSVRFWPRHEKEVAAVDFQVDRPGPLSAPDFTPSGWSLN